MKDVQLILDSEIARIMIAKRNGKKVVEYFGDFVPEQWIWAAGAEPYLICKGGDPQAPEATQQYMLRFMNPLSSSLAGNYLRGMDQVMKTPTPLSSSSMTGTMAAQRRSSNSRAFKFTR